MRTVTLADALRAGRDALHGIEGELDALLATLRDPNGRLDRSAPARLRSATAVAGAAVAALTRSERR